jgi:hypothetical protein
MNEFVDSMVPIGFPTSCLSICSRLQKFLVLIPMVDPLMFPPHSITPHVWLYLLWCRKAHKDNPWLHVFLPHKMHKPMKIIWPSSNLQIHDPMFWLCTSFDPTLDSLDVSMTVVFQPTHSPMPLHNQMNVGFFS